MINHEALAAIPERLGVINIDELRTFLTVFLVVMGSAAIVWVQKD